jgi:ribonuclease HI
MGKKGPKNRFYAFETGEDRGVVDSWAACEAKVKGRQARYRGFVDRADAEAWLAGDTSVDRACGASGRHKVYAYVAETGAGIVDSWDECEALVRGRPARYRGFADRAAARAWLEGGARYEDRAAERSAALRDYPDDAVFFDAGTGRGRGTEVRVVDREGAPVVHLGAGSEGLPGELTEEGTVLLGRARTNNFGELLGCLLAIRAAEVLGSRHVYGDSQLVLDYWSRGRVTADKRRADPDLARLANETAAARRRFEAAGGSLAHIPGGLNPADLGFHRE